MRSLGIAAVLAASCVPAFSTDLTPDAIRAMLQSQDARTVVQSLDGGGEGAGWSAVLDHIEAGDRGWIDLVPLLAPGTDAGTAEGLTITLSRALKSNPAGVLALLTANAYSVEDICLDNDIEVPPVEVAQFLDQAMVAVAAVLDPSLRQARNACLFQMGDLRVSTLI